MDIVVLAGGLSTERDVSFVTGSGVTQALRRCGHRVIMADLYLGLGREGEDLEGIFSRSEEVSMVFDRVPELAPDLDAVRAQRADPDCIFGPNVLNLCRRADIVFIALHGANGEDGRVQAAFDLLGVRYTGAGYLASALAMDKRTTKIMLDAAGIPTARWISLQRGENAPQLDLPCVVKPCCGGSSIGVSIVRESEELPRALEEAFSWEDRILVEEYLPGREYSVGVIEGKALPVMELAPLSGFYDFKNKYQPGSTVETCPAPLPEDTTARMQTRAEQVCKTLGLEQYARVDFILHPTGEIYCLEANSLPGLTPASILPQEAAALGIGYDELCQKLVDVSLRRYGA